MAILLAALVVGLVVGSALTALTHRTITGGDWFSGRSHCPLCQHTLPPRDLIPVLSFILLRGQCRSCHGPISWLYPTIEIVTALLFVAVVVVHTGGIPAAETFGDPHLRLLVLRDWAVVAVSILLFAVDAGAEILPDAITLPAAALFFLWNLLLGDLGFPSMAAGALAGSGFFALQHLLSGGRWIGVGDIRFGLLIGIILGWPAAPVALLVAYVFGAVVALMLILRGTKTWGDHVPFGTFLSAATVGVLLFGDALLRWYGRLL